MVVSEAENINVVISVSYEDLIRRCIRARKFQILLIYLSLVVLVFNVFFLSYPLRLPNLSLGIIPSDLCGWDK